MKGSHKAFLIGVYLLGVFLRLYPRLSIDPHLLTFQGDVWYRLAMAQYIFDHHALPIPDLRYRPYGEVPMWYPPASPIFFAAASYLTGLDIPTVSSRIVPFLEALAPLSIFFLARRMYGETAASISTLALALTPTFVFWTGMSDPQALTLFLIPLYVLFWLKHIETPKSKNVAVLGIVLAANFFVHLSYFVAVFVLFSVTTSLVMRNMAKRQLFLDLILVILISQLLTAPWWLPNNLYWWWIKALVTSSGMYSASWQIGDFGAVSIIFGIVSLLYILAKSRYQKAGSKYPNWNLMLLFWALPIFIESQNEAILFALNRVDLTWTTLAKPLEGFRFFPYLAQPLAIAVGAALSDLSKKPIFDVESSKNEAMAVFFVLAAFLWGITSPYNIETKFQTSGLV